MAFFKLVFARYYAQSVGFSYWWDKKDREVYIIASAEGSLEPFDVKDRIPKLSLDNPHFKFSFV